MKEARKFTRESPVTKVELHNAFFDGHRYTKCAVVDFKVQCGDNAIKYLVREGYVDTLLMGGVDYYVLSDDGEEWLREGLKRFLVLHPERAPDVRQATTAKPARRVIRRTMR